jgi:hypothetical protein
VILRDSAACSLAVTPSAGRIAANSQVLCDSNPRMSDPKKHHYLPVFYLKQWAALDGRVIRYHRPNREVVAHPIAPKNTAYEEALYSLEGYQPEQRNVIEKKFMGPEVDDPAVAPLRHFLERRPASELTVPMRQAWTRFLMSLHVRNPGRVEQITAQGAEAIREMLAKDPEEYDAVRKPNDPPTLVEWVERYAPTLIENYGKSILPGIVTHQAIGNEIIRMQWVVGSYGATPDILTCDQPLHLSHGVNEPKCVLALPLSPCAIFFASRQTSSLDKLMRMERSALIRAINETVVTQAARYVYGAHDRALGFVEHWLARAVCSTSPGGP